MLSSVYFELFYLTVFVVPHFHDIYEIGIYHRCPFVYFGIVLILDVALQLYTAPLYELLDPGTKAQPFDSTAFSYCTTPVSYTHLTLPTILLV